MPARFASVFPPWVQKLNFLMYTYVIPQVETLAEGLVFAEKTGLGTANLHKFIESVMGGPFPAYSKRMTEGGYMTDEVSFNHTAQECAIPSACMIMKHILMIHAAPLLHPSGNKRRHARN